MGDLFVACKKGDMERVRVLIEEMKCDYNVTDKWNSTPLYYACLSGHTDIVHYLLQSGAQCNLDLAGERCMNSALTDEIRNMLRNPPERKSNEKNSFREAMALMLSEGMYSDVCLVVGGNQRLNVHKVVLCRHSAYFTHSLHGPNRGKYFIHFPHPKESNMSAWVEVLKYMYTQRMEIDREASIYKDCLHLSRRLGLKELTSLLRAAFPKLDKKGTARIIPIESECCYYPDIAEIALSDTTPEGSRKGRQEYSDLCIIVQNRRFYCHKAFVVANSPYFAALLDSTQFTEVTLSTRGKLTFITLNNIRAETFALIITYIYTGYTNVCEETLQDLLYYSDHYMIHGLKLACSEVLASRVDLSNAVQTLLLARMLRMTRLQHAALRFIAYNFENVDNISAFGEELRQDESCLRRRRLVRVSESSLDEEEEEEDSEEELPIESTCVDIQMDLRLYLREHTNKQQHSMEAQLREEACVSAIALMLAG